MPKIGPNPDTPDVQDLPTDFRFTPLWEAPSELAVSATAVTPRLYSPFTISIIPPDIFGDAQLTNQTKRRPTYAARLYDKAAKEVNNLHSAQQKQESRQQNQIARSLKPTTQKFMVNGRIRKADKPDTFPKAFVNDDDARDLLAQWETLSNLKPLTLMINPTSLAVQLTKLAQFTERTRNRNVYQAYREEAVKLSLTINTGGFYSSGTGLSWFSQQNSAAWQHFQALLLMFRNGAAIYNRLDSANPLNQAGMFQIDYDQWRYTGTMEGLDYSYDATKPNACEVNLEFTAYLIQDVAQPVTQVNPLGAAGVVMQDTSQGTGVATGFSTGTTQTAVPQATPTSAFRLKG